VERTVLRHAIQDRSESRNAEATFHIDLRPLLLGCNAVTRAKRDRAVLDIDSVAKGESRKLLFENTVVGNISTDNCVRDAYCTGMSGPQVLRSLLTIACRSDATTNG
jgi:hypothetical protein